VRWKGRNITEEVASKLVGSEAAIADFAYNHPDAAGPESISVALDDWVPNEALFEGVHTDLTTLSPPGDMGA
jgi:hypothetical protein